MFIFLKSGNGYVRSEAAVVIFLQKASVARRVYATVVNARTNTDGNKEQGITFPSGEMQKKLMKEVYSEAGINPADVVYVEAHGTGTKVNFIFVFLSTFIVVNVGSTADEIEQVFQGPY
jgi:fatty acid synthase